MIGAFQFVLDTPKCYGKSPNGQQRTDATGVPPQLSVCQSRPHCLRRFLSRSDCDWTGVSLSSLWVTAKSGAARYFESIKIGSPPFNRPLPLGRSWRTAAHAYAHHNHKEKVFGEWVFDCQGTAPFSPHKGKLGKRFFVLSPSSPWETSNFPYSKNFFNFSLSLSIRL